jgi:hypothetical protein
LVSIPVAYRTSTSVIRSWSERAALKESRFP